MLHELQSYSKKTSNTCFYLRDYYAKKIHVKNPCNLNLINKLKTYYV